MTFFKNSSRSGLLALAANGQTIHGSIRRELDNPAVGYGKLHAHSQYHSTTALHTHISPGGWTIGPLLAAVQRHSLTTSTRHELHTYTSSTAVLMFSSSFYGLQGSIETRNLKHWGCESCEERAWRKGHKWDVRFKDGPKEFTKYQLVELNQHRAQL
jgi:hypothetical protein